MKNKDLIRLNQISKIVLLAVVLGLVGSSIYGQSIEERTKKKTEQKANNRVDQKVDNALNKGFDSIEGLFKKKKQKDKDEDKKENASADEAESSDQQTANSEQMQNYMQMFGGDADIADSYDFDYYFTTHFTNTTGKSGKVEETDFDIFINRSTGSMAMIFQTNDKKGPGQITSIIDPANKSMVNLIDNPDKKTGMVMEYDPEKIKDELKDPDEELQVNFHKTGRTKSILGYNCEEYTFDSGEDSGTIWMTTELELSSREIYSIFGTQSKNDEMEMLKDYPEGFALETNTTDEDSGDTSQMLVTEIHPNSSKSISTKGYQIINVGAMMKRGKN